MYDDNAKKVGIKAIATVESNNDYTAINYNDPITIGVVQWFGTRAAALLNRFKNENPTAWSGVHSRLVLDLATYSETSSFWNNRDLTDAEGLTLEPVLAANKPIQNDQIIKDFDDYMVSALIGGIDPDSNTKALLFYFNIYHQSPKQARYILSAAGPDSSMSRLRAYVANNRVLGAPIYKNRYDTAYAIIDAMDSSGVDDPAPVPDGEYDGGTDPNVDGIGGTRTPGNIRYAQKWQDNLIIQLANNQKLTFYPAGNGYFMPIQNASVGASVPPPAPLDPDPDPIDPNDPPSSTGDELVRFLAARLDLYRYSQTLSGRNSPDTSGYTDCSALVAYAYRKVLGIRLGGNTVAQYTEGRRITSSADGGLNFSLLQKGDLIYFGWPGGRGTVDHVEMFYGGTQSIGHGGPDTGPDIQALQPMIDRAARWYVQRHIQDE